MSIYSSNRMGRVSTTEAVANENYGSSDIGRVLYESQVNDQAFFEAIVLSDLREIDGIKEGTLLESEIKALNEANVKEFFEKMRKRLKEFWEKIKGVFKDVTTKIAIFITKDAKKFLKDFDKNFKMSNYKGDVYTNACNVPIATHFKIPNVSEIKKEVERNKDSAYVDKTAILHEKLADSIHGCKEKYLTPKDFKIEAKRLIFGEKPAPIESASDINNLKNNISSASNSIKTINEQKNKIEKGIKDLENELKDAEKKSGGDGIRNISALISIYENLTSIVMNTVIGCVKVNIRKSYSTLNEILRKSTGASSVTTESACILAEEAVDEVLNGEVEELDKETQEAVDTIVDASSDDI